MPSRRPYAVLRFRRDGIVPVSLFDSFQPDDLPSSVVCCRPAAQADAHAAVARLREQHAEGGQVFFTMQVKKYFRQSPTTVRPPAPVE